MLQKENGDLVLEDGTVIPAEKRTRCEVWSRPVGYPVHKHKCRI